MIESVENNKIKYLRKLKQKKYIDEEGKFLVEGYHLVEEALKNELVLELLLLNDTDINYDGTKTYVNEKVMKSISSLETMSPVIAVCKKLSEKELGKKVVILDGVQDPGNAGTIIRNSVAFEADTIVFSPDSVSIYNDKVIRASQGMIFNINLITKDLNEVIDELKDKNIMVYGTSLKNSILLSSLETTNDYALIFGSEGSGIKESLLKKCDKVINIKMNSKCESLNVGVSSGIILYHFKEHAL